jgi:hypothetical protein
VTANSWRANAKPAGPASVRGGDAPVLLVPAFDDDLFANEPQMWRVI